MADSTMTEVVALLTLDDREYELRCMLPECGRALTEDQAYFCSQPCLDAYIEPDVDAMGAEEWQAHKKDFYVREARMDRLRAADPSRHLAPAGWQPGDPLE